MSGIDALIRHLVATRTAPDAELLPLLDPDWLAAWPERRAAADAALMAAARAERRRVYGDTVFLRGLIEFTNYCSNDCYYCGIRASNRAAVRYRLDEAAILAAVETVVRAGLGTVVLQGGEDPLWTCGRLEALVREIRGAHPDLAITLSVGEHPAACYQALRAAGADRYLLREETADPRHYALLHPPHQQLATRLRALADLRAAGYQVGGGFMVGSPGQSPRELLADLRYLQQLRPEMIGIGPFLHHHETPFAAAPDGDLRLTLRLVALLRLLLPSALLPATTALATASEAGRVAGLNAGANVLMPNFTPPAVRADYSLYDNKSRADTIDADLAEIRRQVESAGCRIDIGRGDWRAAPEG